MSRFFPTPAERGRHTVFGNVPVATHAGEHLQMSLVDIPADGVVNWHSHAAEQIGVVVSGRAVFHVGDESQELGPGDPFVIPGGVPHKVVPINGPVRAVDAFYPIRDEYR